MKKAAIENSAIRIEKSHVLNNMTDLKWCIDYLKGINSIKQELDDSFATFKALLNITMPINLSNEFYQRQDKVLQDILPQIGPMKYLTNVK